ncbi:hypothetical protein HYALB_00009466 [Hymenoscyphus albidus]|uniref:N-acetyltransferase domain-containing protein n=1 Tax=Hymenoscyphus albidus TaxID=595503 RepID=A0A9N9QBK8_9HELO|nr:hypothetical protein HYALB_00009466 [Hymenoscyphus albidus]
MASSHTQQSVSSEDEDDMDLDSGPEERQSQTSVIRNRESLALISRDATDWLPHIKTLRETDVIILLTPVVTPISQDPNDLSDPFEPLGRSLAKRHAKIRQVPYTQRNGITSTHLGFIKRGQVIILCFALRPGQQIPMEFADITFAVSDNKPCIIVVCCNPINENLAVPFPTVIQTAGYSPPALESTAALIFGEIPSRVERPLESDNADPNSPRLWPVEQWIETRDVSSVLELWNQNINGRFSLDEATLASLLRRPGYAKHYVVRDMSSGVILGFCATYLAYVDKEGEKLIASLAVLLVRSTHRKLGIGLSLHSHAVSQLKRTRGVIRLQFGSTFPRLLYGPPLDTQFNEEWFRRRSWQLSKEIPGQGQIVYDLILDLAKWKNPSGSPSNPAFRICTQVDMMKVIEMVETTSEKQGKMGWFDQYNALMNGPNVKDIIIAVENGDVVATALTYTGEGSPISSNLPWASRIGDDVGGVTCICISPSQDQDVLKGLLDACVKNLQAQGMRRMFLDGVSSGLDTLIDLGFEQWARYTDVWKDT